MIMMLPLSVLNTDINPNPKPITHKNRQQQLYRHLVCWIVNCGFLTDCLYNKNCSFHNITIGNYNADVALGEK